MGDMGVGLLRGYLVGRGGGYEGGVYGSGVWGRREE